jgi:hypothetical protein
MHGARFDDDAKLNSPVCWANEAPDEYMGYASRYEILEFLNAIYECRQSIARVLLRTSLEADGAVIAADVFELYREEVKWCGTLRNCIADLGGIPSHGKDRCYEDAMALRGLPERIAFVRAQQLELIPKIESIRPKVRADELYAHLDAMKRSIDGSSAQRGGPVIRRAPR